MKCSESWLREWVNPNLSREHLCHALTMSGLEIEDCSPVAGIFSGVIIGEIIKITKHPKADKLNLCEVMVGGNQPLNIVCGANNIKMGMKVPVATIGAILPNDIVIKASTIRDIASEGMLCSAKELGLAEESEGILALETSAPIGEDVRNYLKLDDYVIDISITPNRGDCLSIKGLAREVSALTQTPLTELTIAPVQPKLQETYSLTIEAKEACPRYAGRVIRSIKADAASPAWLAERLRRSGIRSISPIVDVTNYVMLELGQPMHAFDLQTIQQGIQVRHAHSGEKIALLDESEKELVTETLVIADHKKPLAIAGVMGGLDSSVTLLTQDIFLESAYFSPAVVAKQRQYYQLNSESAYRFERNIDPTIQRIAIERATQLILDICGGQAGPVLDIVYQDYLPKIPPIELSSTKIKRVLGIALAKEEVNNIFNALRFSYEEVQAKSIHKHLHDAVSDIKNFDAKLEFNNGTWEMDEPVWYVSIPSYRADIRLPEDLIEEIARLYGYDNIPTHHIRAELHTPQEIDMNDAHFLRQALCDQGYHEIISYSFIDKKLQSLLDPRETPRELLNPITADMTVMRTNLWPGLINTLLYNKSRQQHRVRLFEIGTCFVTRETLQQPSRLAGLITGPAKPEQWGETSREVDFYDLKGNLENMLAAIYSLDKIIFKPDSHPALHPGQSAGIYYNEQKIGILGGLHPIILQTLDIDGKVFVFELDLDQLKHAGLKRVREVSKFPEIRRDIAVVVNQAIPAKDIQDTIKVTAGDWLKDVFIFDVYIGKGISPGLKSIALALIFQHPTRTLVDSEVTELVERVTETLQGQLGASLRS